MSGDNDPVLDSDQWCKTSSGDTMVTKFTWTIEDFASLPEKTGHPILSSIFLAKKPNIENSKWQLILYPNGMEDSGDHMSIFLFSLNDVSVKAKYQVSILDFTLKKRKTLKSSICQFAKFEGYDLKGKTKGDHWGLRKWMLRKPLLKNPQQLPDGHLTLLCELTVYGKRKISSGPEYIEDKSIKHAKGLKQVSEHLGKIFTDKDLSDVEIECDGKVFNCHELILSARSDVFRAMFQNDMTENRSKKVDIQNVDPEVVSEMLNFIYTGVTNEDFLKEPENAGELLGAANRYQLGLLKDICEDRLCSALKVGNSIEYLILGDLYQASKLRRMALRMVASNMASLVATEEYNELVKTHPVLAAEIPAAMVEVTNNN